MRGRTGIILCLGLFALALAALPGGQDPVPWLDVPAGWTRGVEKNVITLRPNDLPAGSAMLFMVEPPAPQSPSPSLQAAYEKALADLGPWKPVGQVLEQTADNDWRFRFGIGVARLDGVPYTAITAVALRRNLLARFWMIADSDATFNRYHQTILKAIVSVQDAGVAGPARAVAAPPAASSPAQKLDPAFGKGLSGVYVGLERGARAGVAPPGGSSIQDYQEIDVFFPDGTYRRGLPLRGLGGDLAWERRQQPILWGTWARQGDAVVVRRGSYQARYAVQGEQLVDSRGRAWQKLKPAGAQRLDGVYARADFRDADAPRLVLRADGSYEDRGRFLRMVSSASHLVQPDGEAMLARLSDNDFQKLRGAGSGTYTFANFTLTLRDRDGRVWQINAFVPPGEPLPAARRLVVNTYRLQRD